VVAALARKRRGRATACQAAPVAGVARQSFTPLAQCAGRTSGRAAVLHHRRPHPRATVVKRRGPLRVPPARRSGGGSGVSELALDDFERDALAGKLQRVRVPQLVRREPTPTSAHDVDLPPGNRPRGDDRPPSAHDVPRCCRPAPGCDSDRPHCHAGAPRRSPLSLFTASRRPPRLSPTLSPIGVAQEPYWPAASALTGGPWSPASWKIARTSGSAMNFS
jgi:hypothetical protein